VDPRNQLKKRNDPRTGQTVWELTSALFKFPLPLSIDGGGVRSSIDYGTGVEALERAVQRLNREFPMGGLAAFSQADAMGTGCVEAIEPEPLDSNADHCRLDHHDSPEAYAALARMCRIVVEHRANFSR
jgi:hypothetical protein